MRTTEVADADTVEGLERDLNQTQTDLESLERTVDSLERTVDALEQKVEELTNGSSG